MGYLTTEPYDEFFINHLLNVGPISVSDAVSLYNETTKPIEDPHEAEMRRRYLGTIEDAMGVSAFVYLQRGTIAPADTQVIFDVLESDRDMELTDGSDDWDFTKQSVLGDNVFKSLPRPISEEDAFIWHHIVLSREFSDMVKSKRKFGLRRHLARLSSEQLIKVTLMLLLAQRLPEYGGGFWGYSEYWVWFDYIPWKLTEAGMKDPALRGPLGRVEL